jgi:hypothetical protein
MEQQVNWKSRGGLISSGWRPWAKSGFNWETNQKTVQGSYEDLRPGQVPCCLMMIPPVIIFAPCLCPILSLTSRAYHWILSQDIQEGFIDCLVEEKQFFECDSILLKNVTSVEIIQKHKAHTMSEYDGSTTAISLTTQHILIHHSQGTYQFPEIPIDHHVQAFIHEIQRLLNQSTTSPSRELSSSAIYPANSVVYDSQPLLVKEAVVVFHSNLETTQQIMETCG